MPRYEFKCDRCGKEIERRYSIAAYGRKMEDSRLREHRSEDGCNGHFERVFSTFTFHMGSA